MTQYLDPTFLGIVPPMDLGRGSADLMWRDSLFFNQIEFMHNSDNKIPLLVEAHVLAV